MESPRAGTRFASPLVITSNQMSYINIANSAALVIYRDFSSGGHMDASLSICASNLRVVATVGHMDASLSICVTSLVPTTGHMDATLIVCRT